MNKHNLVIADSDILTCFHASTIGTKVELGHQLAFTKALEEAIRSYDTSKDRVAGQHFVQMPQEVNDLVRGGVGLNSPNDYDYVLRTHRGRVSAYLKRRLALPVTAVHCVVYTLEAYLNDPDVTSKEVGRLAQYEHKPTHVLVAVLSSHNTETPALSPYRLMHNLAGGNHEALAWTADEIRAKAQASKAYDDLYSTVAD